MASDPLPTDPDELRQFAASLQAELARKEIEIAANAAEIHAKTLHIEHLKAQLAVLRRARFGRSSEKLDREIEQFELLIGDLEEDAAEAQARTANRHARSDADLAQPRERRHPTRTPLPPYLPRETITHEPVCTCPGCGGSQFSRIGQDEREVLEYVPSSFKVIRHVRPKLSCRACETIIQAPMPSLPIERGRPGPGLLAHVAVAKFADHIPLHRQTTMYAREGVELDRATLADWVGQVMFLLAPLVEAIAQHVLTGAVLHADDTTIPVLAPGLGRTRTGRLWVVVRDERPWGSGVPPAAVYRYSPDRKAEHAEALLGACRGFLHADGYAGFGKLYQPLSSDIRN
ncbi:MAG TPA: IS66 family transposase [Dongiaceae bacterium]